jgi:hypothetical protein
MYWMGLLVCVFFNGLGFLFAPRGKKHFALPFLFFYVLWAFLMFTSGTAPRVGALEEAINWMILIGYNLLCIWIYHRTWVEHRNAP